MKEITKDLLKEISEWNGEFKGAYNIREDGACVGRVSSPSGAVRTFPFAFPVMIRIIQLVDYIILAIHRTRCILISDFFIHTLPLSVLY